MAEIPIVSNNSAREQFELPTQNGPAVLRYKARDGTLDLQHTLVPKAQERRGYGTALVKAALDHARTSGTKVIPTCPFVKAYMDEHPEYADVRASAA
jgi:predicted GNAT family acetyltransferase